MAVAHKTAIAFSLVSIPVSLYTATQDTDIQFNQLRQPVFKGLRDDKAPEDCVV